MADIATLTKGERGKSVAVAEVLGIGETELPLFLSMLSKEGLAKARTLSNVKYDLNALKSQAEPLKATGKAAINRQQAKLQEGASEMFNTFTNGVRALNEFRQNAQKKKAEEKSVIGRLNSGDVSAIPEAEGLQKEGRGGDALNNALLRLQLQQKAAQPPPQGSLGGGRAAFSP